MKQELIHVGAIVNAHGIRGEVKLNPVGFDPDFLAEFDIVYFHEIGRIAFRFVDGA